MLFTDPGDWGGINASDKAMDQRCPLAESNLKLFKCKGSDLGYMT